MDCSFSIDQNEKRVLVTLKGEISSENAEEWKKTMLSESENRNDWDWVLDLKELNYISSAGLRVLLELKKKISGKILLTQVQKPLVDIFVITGFDHFFEIEPEISHCSIEGCECIGRGANGAVYRLDSDRIIKVFYEGVSLESVKKEQKIGHEVFLTGLPTVISYGLEMTDEGQYGIILEMLGHNTLSETIEKEPEHFEKWMERYAELYKNIHETRPEGEHLPRVKDLYRGYFEESADWYTAEEMEKLYALLESIPERDTLIHGDYHPNNIMVSNDELILIDLGDFSIGHPIFDFLATAATQANLVELDPQFAETHTRMKAENIKKAWKELVDRSFADRTEEEREKLDRQIRLWSKLKVACAPAVAKGIPDEIMQMSVDDVKYNLIPHVDELIGSVDW